MRGSIHAFASRKLPRMSEPLLDVRDLRTQFHTDDGVVKALNIDLVHFGLMMIVNLLIGALTPPFGVLLFITMDIARVSFAAICKAVLPFYIPLMATLLLVTYWPEMVLFVPELFRG